MLTNIDAIFKMIIVTGFLTFVPKYMEVEFGIKTSEAALYTGMHDSSHSSCLMT